MPLDDLPELAPSRPARGRRWWRVVPPGLILLIACGYFVLTQRERLFPASGELRAEITRLTEERASLAAEVNRLSLNESGAEAALDSAFANTQWLADEITDLKGRIQQLQEANHSLDRELDREKQRARHEIGRLQADLDRWESLTRHDRESDQAEMSRLLAANQNLERQNAILKDRLSGALLANTDLPEGSNAEAALARGSLEIDALEQRVASLEKLLSDSGEDRTRLARSLSQSRENQTAADLYATLNASAGDRFPADLTGRVESLRLANAATQTALTEDRLGWEAEKAALVTSRDQLRREVLTLREKLQILAQPPVAPPLATPPLETAIIRAPEDLSTATRPIFDALRALPSDSSASLPGAYANITRDLGGRLAITLPFAADSADLDDRARQEIRALVSASPQSRYLAIGYASTDGSESGNRELSSRRALAAAESVAACGPAHPVEAVYFGQTSRFDPYRRAANRIVEIWRID